MELTLLLIIAALLVALLALTLTRNNRAQSEEMQRALRQQMQENREELNRSIRELRMEMTQTLNQGLQQLQDAMHKNMMTTGELQRQKFDAMARQQETLIQSTEKRLDDMRVMVEEKLQKTLNERIGQSFEIVRSQLENVQKGLGEMKAAQLAETTLHPDTRRLLPVSLGDVSEAVTGEIMNLLMATKGATGRKLWMEEYGDRVEADV